jgi:hypothetical protein
VAPLTSKLPDNTTANTNIHLHDKEKANKMTIDLENNSINNYESITLYVEWDLTTEDNEILTSDEMPSKEIIIYRDTILDIADLAADEYGDVSWDDFGEKLCDWLSDTHGWCVNYWDIDTYELID